MASSRRDFLKTTGLALGAATLPEWLRQAEAAAALLDRRDELADLALSEARRLRASYADFRVGHYRRERIATREQQVAGLSRSQSLGFGVRVLVDGAWGFASNRELTPAAVRRATRQAAEVARANAAHQRRPVELAPVSRVVDDWQSAFERDPFEVPISDKIAFLLRLNETAQRVEGVSFVNSNLQFVSERKFFASTEGSRIEQYIVRAFPQFSVTAVDRDAGDFQSRNSLPGPQNIGYEFLEQYPWLAEAEQAANDAVEKLGAASVEPGEYDLVLDPSNLWLTIHENVGHPTELDRALGWEANYAGTSFLTAEMAGEFQYGSERVHLFADRTQPRGMATVGYDDDGIPSQRWDIVREGRFVGWQTTRDLAPLIGDAASNGCCHADSWGSMQFPRMPNLSLAPAQEDTSLEELLAGVEKGIWIAGRGSYSIDQQRYNGQFGGQVFWEIRAGRKTRMLNDVAYQIRTPDFWAALDGLGGESTYEVWGSFGDAKGEPTQLNAVSHGCPVARFRNINVLNTAR